jgi:hypothetical protein
LPFHPKIQSFLHSLIFYIETRRTLSTELQLTEISGMISNDHCDAAPGNLESQTRIPTDVQCRQEREVTAGKFAPLRLSFCAKITLREVKNLKFYFPLAAINLAWAFLILAAVPGCSSELRNITGRVVDESGHPMLEVAVTACYSGWGLSGGQLVWDKDYCSEPVLTSLDGLYVINFAGPEVMRLMAKKEGWVQTRDYNSRDPGIVLTRAEDYRARNKAEAGTRERKARRRSAGESDADYYCRVVLPEARPVVLKYQGESLSVTPSLLGSSDSREALFALRGSPRATRNFAGEVRLRVNGRSVNGKFSLGPAASACGSDIHFVRAIMPNSVEGNGGQVEILVPGISAMLDMQIWSASGEP